jgi:hypothetical protein
LKRFGQGGTVKYTFQQLCELPGEGSFIALVDTWAEDIEPGDQVPFILVGPHGHVFVAQFVERAPNSYGWTIAKNWSDLEVAAVDAVHEQGGSVTERVLYPCPADLACRAYY